MKQLRLDNYLEFFQKWTSHRDALSTLWSRSCFLRIFVSTTAIIYSKLFSLTLLKFVLLCLFSLDDAIRNMKANYFSTLVNYFFINSIENCSICKFWCFDLHDFYKETTYEFMQNICLNALLFVNRGSRWQMLFKIGTSQYSQENTCVGVGSLFLIKLQARWLLLTGVKFTLTKFYADAN